MSEPIEVRLGRNIACVRLVLLRWIVRRFWGRRADTPTPLAGPSAPSPAPATALSGTSVRPEQDAVPGPREREIRRRFARELLDLGLQRRNELIMKASLDEFSLVVTRSTPRKRFRDKVRLG